jgi:hypothetical protein
MNNQTIKFIKRSIVLVTFVIIIFVLITVLSSLKFHVVSTEPSIGSFPYAVSSLKINFNKDVSDNNLKLTSSPDIINSYTGSGKTITIKIKGLAIGKKYTVELNKVQDTSGSALSNKSIVFIARNINTNILPKDEKQAILKNQENYSSPSNNPIVADLPYQTLDFDLTADVSTVNDKPGLVLDAELYLSEADMSNEAAAIQNEKNEVTSYIQSLNFNPNNYDIVYSVSTP